MDNELYDYRKYDQIWQRVDPRENPYPNVRGAADTVSVSAAAVPQTMYQTLLKEELRHMQEVLHALENALA